MALVKLFFVIATMMILTLTLTMNLENNGKTATDEMTTKELSINQADHLKLVKLPKRFSRFLVEQKNPRASDHCKKDSEICFVLEGKNLTCCNNKCTDLMTDLNNCGACKNKCKYTETCCGGQCVNLASNGTHCGVCGNMCMPGAYCLKGMCNYA